MEPNSSCSFCSKDIFKTERNLKKYKLHFCNRLCHQLYLKKNSKNIIVKCNYCNKKLIKNTTAQRNSRTGLFFCDNLCKNRFLAKRRSWTNDNSFHHKQRKYILYKKADNQCQNCNYDKDARMLDIHHYDNDHNNNDVGNLRILCVWCHNLCHRTGVIFNIPAIIFEKELKNEVRKWKKGCLDKCKRSKGEEKKPKICLICNKYYIPWSKKQKCCSSECGAIFRRTVVRPNKEELIELVKTQSLVKIGKKYGVSDNAVRK